MLQGSRLVVGSVASMMPTTDREYMVVYHHRHLHVGPYAKDRLRGSACVHLEAMVVVVVAVAVAAVAYHRCQNRSRRGGAAGRRHHLGFVARARRTAPCSFPRRRARS